ncbi:hypothetical protein SuNHUV7_05190 (plasmid) [Pseudoseohaeicola sp. NH-UV-7]
MSSNNTDTIIKMPSAPTSKKRQERRIRWKYGLTEAQARVIAGLYYGEVK